MEWLMGKARGVGRGLISGSNSSSNTTSIPVSLSSPESVSSPPDPNPPSPPPYLKSSFLKQQLSLSVAGNIPVDFPLLVEPEHPLEEDEWIAVHTIGLVENLCSIFDPLYEMCLCRPTGSHSPKSSSGTNGANDFVEFLLSQSKKPVRQVISLLLSECNDAIQSARIFPVKQGEAFSPSDLRDEASKICRKLLLCLVHIYSAHVVHLEQLDLVAHLNTIAKHFFAFTMRFKLLNEDGEDNKVLGALHGLHRQLLATPAPNVIVVAESSQPVMPQSVNIPQIFSDGKETKSESSQLESVEPLSISSILDDSAIAAIVVHEQPAG
nr:Mob1 phocein [Hymenolepis microstoma]